MSKPIPLWLDCDPGHDDAFAILLAANHPSLHLLGVSTVHGNAPLTQTTRNAGSVLTAIGRADIRVYPGASKPFCRDAVHASDIHGASGIDGTDLLPEPTTPPMTSIPAVQAMRDALLGQPSGTAWVVATGSMTNTSVLFAAFPELVEHVAGVSIMGGAIGDDFSSAPLGKVGKEKRHGNVTPYAEFNIYTDPEAARSIFSHPPLARKTYMVTLDVTHLARATPPIQQRLLHGAGADTPPTRLRRMFHDLLLFFAGTYSRVFGLGDGPPLHDPLAVAILLDPEHKRFKYSKLDNVADERWHVEVVTQGQHAEEHKDGAGMVSYKKETNKLGATLLHAAEGEGSYVPRSVDVDWFFEEILAAVDRAEQRLNAVAKA